MIESFCPTCMTWAAWIPKRPCKVKAVDWIHQNNVMTRYYFIAWYLYQSIHIYTCIYIYIHINILEQRQKQLPSSSSASFLPEHLRWRQNCIGSWKILQLTATERRFCHADVDQECVTGISCQLFDSVSPCFASPNVLNIKETSYESYLILCSAYPEESRKVIQIHPGFSSHRGIGIKT